MSIFGLIGMQCFNQAECDQCLGRQNFDTFGNALLTLFQVLTSVWLPESPLMCGVQVLTGENWEQIFRNCAEVDAVLAVPFFVCYVVLVNWCLVEMLVAVRLSTSSSNSMTDGCFQVIVEKFEISEAQREVSC